MLDELREIAGERLRLVPTPGPFNFSAKINLGAVRSEGEHLLLLNDDIEVTTPDWIERMVMYSELRRESAPSAAGCSGATGACSTSGSASTAACPATSTAASRGDFRGYANAVLIARNCLAVTGACLMTPRAVFEEVGGLSTTLPINFNDVDYCLKVHASGRRIVYDPDLVLYHFESSSRDPEVRAWEIEQLVERWGHTVAVDPFNNPNLSRGMPRIGSIVHWAKRSPRTLLPRRLAA